jgi:hypothetical protein
MRIFAVCLGGADTDEYGDRVAETSDAELQRVRRIHQLRSYRIASVVRIGVVGLMVAAMIIGTERSEWTHQSLLIVVYAFIALCAVARAFSPIHHWVALGQLEPFAFNVIDVIALTVFQVLSTNGIYPLLIMTMLPILLGLDVSSRRAAVVLICSMVGFAIAVLQDPEMIETIGWFEATFRFVLYGFLCATAFVAVRMADRHTRAVAGLSALREELLAQTMTASDVMQRRISETIHDGPLQDILVVRQEMVRIPRRRACRARAGRPARCLTEPAPGDFRVASGRSRAGRTGCRRAAVGRLHRATFGHRGRHRHRLPGPQRDRSDRIRRSARIAVERRAPLEGPARVGHARSHRRQVCFECRRRRGRIRQRDDGAPARRGSHRFGIASNPGGSGRR